MYIFLKKKHLQNAYLNKCVLEIILISDAMCAAITDVRGLRFSVLHPLVTFMFTTLFIFTSPIWWRMPNKYEYAYMINFILGLQWWVMIRWSLYTSVD